MKRLAIWTAVVLVLLVGGVMLTVDTLARRAIEAGVEAGVGLPTDVGSVSLRLLLGSFRMDDLEIANPEGFESDHLLRLGRVETTISYADLRSGDVVLERLLLSDLDLNLEWKGRSANYEAILGAEKKQGGAAPSEPAAAPESQTRFIIDELVVRDVVAHVRIAPVGEAEVKLPELRLEGVGRKEGGVVLAEVASRVTGAVLAEVMREGRGLAPEFSAKLGSGLQQLRGLGSGSTGEKAGKASDLLRGLLKKGD